MSKIVANHDRRKVSDYEMQRRTAFHKASGAILIAMENHELTPLEWVSVLQSIQRSIVDAGLKEEWEIES